MSTSLSSVEAARTSVENPAKTTSTTATHLGDLLKRGESDPPGALYTDVPTTPADCRKICQGAQPVIQAIGQPSSLASQHYAAEIMKALTCCESPPNHRRCWTHPQVWLAGIHLPAHSKVSNLHNKPMPHKNVPCDAVAMSEIGCRCARVGRYIYCDGYAIHLASDPCAGLVLLSCGGAEGHGQCFAPSAAQP